MHVLEHGVYLSFEAQIRSCRDNPDAEGGSPSLGNPDGYCTSWIGSGSVWSTPTEVLSPLAELVGLFGPCGAFCKFDSGLLDGLAIQLSFRSSLGLDPSMSYPKKNSINLKISHN